MDFLSGEDGIRTSLYYLSLIIYFIGQKASLALILFNHLYQQKDMGYKHFMPLIMPLIWNIHTHLI
ncbi:MAG: hypothetical protein CMC14_11365 [Flavobacteriaceae bacterium]|nr:hypothetical protein [Flavobacteriaceae bacterium]